MRPVIGMVIDVAEGSQTMLTDWMRYHNNPHKEGGGGGRYWWNKSRSLNTTGCQGSSEDAICLLPSSQTKILSLDGSLLSNQAFTKRLSLNRSLTSSQALTEIMSSLTISSRESSRWYNEGDTDLSDKKKDPKGEMKHHCQDWQSPLLRLQCNDSVECAVRLTCVDKPDQRGV